MNNKEYQEWLKKVKEIEEHNEKVLIEFQEYLEKKSLSPKTINKHVDNMRFYANDFLLRYDLTPIEQGSDEIGSFLGDYFIRKTSWASKYTIQDNATGFIKLYTFLHEKGSITKEELMDMKEMIKEKKPYWIGEVERYWDDIL